MNKIHLKRAHYPSFFWFTLVSTNGKILMTSETYTTKRSAVKGIKSSAKGTSIKTFTDHTKEGKPVVVKL
jgi:uncharacterized protein YegP (UPF0339 family)